MIKRLYVYLSEMFPPMSIFGTYFFVIVMASAVCVDNGSFDFLLDPKLHMAGIVIVLMSLMVRIMDEFKDYEDDLRNFPDRPLPSGRVQAKDLKVLQAIVISSFFLLSSYNLYVFIACSICMAYSYLMWKWFFIEDKMRKSLPLALATHNPVILFYFGYICTVLYQLGYITDMSKLFIGIPLMLTMTNWEISRKLRSPADETDYTTYSKIWGPKKAASVCLIIQAIILGGVNYYFKEIQSNIAIVVLFNLSFLYITYQYIKYIKVLEHKLPFRNYAEGLALVTQVSIIVASLI